MEGRKKASWSTAPAMAAVALSLCLPAHAAPKCTVLHSFTGGPDGNGNAGVSLDEKGNVYGASLGGGSQDCQDGCGLVWELTPGAGGNWTLTPLYDFTGGDDGQNPYAPPTFGPAGVLYGTTEYGGAPKCGTAFELTPGSGGWEQSVLYAFGEQPGDGVYPTAGLAIDPAGNLYGTTPKAGAHGGGTVFELFPGAGRWNETVLYAFCPTDNCPNGDDPYAGLILDASGNLYGTTSYGGKGCGGDGCGVVYELSPVSGGRWKETVLHRFDNNGKDGYTPGNGALFMDALGNLYGTTEVGGAGAGADGMVFRLTPGPHGRWRETILYNFNGGAEGGYPSGGVVMDNGGNLYGLTADGGIGCGVLYKLAPGGKGKWAYSVLHTFGQGADGCIPVGNLVLDKKGNLYGGTVLGGTTGNGIVFELTP